MRWENNTWDDNLYYTYAIGSEAYAYGSHISITPHNDANWYQQNVITIKSLTIIRDYKTKKDMKKYVNYFGGRNNSIKYSCLGLCKYRFLLDYLTFSITSKVGKFGACSKSAQCEIDSTYSNIVCLSILVLRWNFLSISK